TASKWWEPAGAVGGTDTMTENAPWSSVTTEPTMIGVEWNVIVTVDLGAKPDPDTVTRSAGCTARAVTPRADSGAAAVDVGALVVGGVTRDAGVVEGTSEARVVGGTVVVAGRVPVATGVPIQVSPSG